MGTFLYDFNDPPVGSTDPQRKTIEYHEIEGSPTFRLSDNGTQMVRKLHVNWDEKDEAMKDLLGYPVLKFNNGRYYIYREIPASANWIQSSADGFSPARPYIWCTDLQSVEPALDVPLTPKVPANFVDANANVDTIDKYGVHRYGRALIVAQYETLTYEILKDSDMLSAGAFDLSGNPDESTLKRYVTILATPQQSSQILPQGTFVFASDGTAYAGTPSKIEIECDLRITWHRVLVPAIGLRCLNPYIVATDSGLPYYAPIENCLGCVNQTTFAGCAKGTLLLTAVIIKPIRSPLGQRLYDVEYVFKIFFARSAKKLTQGVVTDYQYGHNLVYVVTKQPNGYYELVSPLNNMTLNCLVVSGSPIGIALDTQTLFPGLTVTGVGIPVGTTILSVDSATQFTMSNNATASSLSVVLTFASQTGSNYLLTPPIDNVNLYNYREFRDLFRVPIITV